MTDKPDPQSTAAEEAAAAAATATAEALERRRDITKRLWALSWPLIGINVLSVMAVFVDTAMCGRLPDAELALTALGYAGQIIFLLMVANLGLMVGAIALVARAVGSNDPERVRQVVGQALVLVVVVSVGVAVLGNALAGPLLTLLGASETTRAAGMEYLHPLLTGTIFYYAWLLLAGLCRGVGNTRLPFMVALLMNGLNGLFNYALILGNLGFPALGVRGAAYGTLLSQAIAVVVLMVLLRRGAVPGLTVPLKLPKLDRQLSMQLFRIGAPAALDLIILNASFLSIVGMLGRIDEVAVAAHGLGLRVQALAFVPGMSISQATGALVGQALGGGSVDRAKQIVRVSVVMCTVIMGGLGLIIIMASYPIVGIFDVAEGSTLERFSVMWIELLGYCMPIVGVYIAFVGMLQGAGATWTSLRINLLATLAIQIPLSYILGFVVGWGVFGVWVAFPLSFVIKAGLGAGAYRRGRWSEAIA